MNGRTGLFPSNHVEKLATATPTPASPPYAAAAPVATGEKKVYRPFMAAHHGADAPPAANSGAVNSVGLQQDAGQETKKSKYGKLGNTVSRTCVSMFWTAY